MGLLDKLFKRNQKENEEISYKKLTQEEINNILDQEVVNLFPQDGHWTSACFSKGDYLQCHLRDAHWLAHWFQRKLEKKDIYISRYKIFNYVTFSKLFDKCRHDYELEIVRWQINWMKNGGEGWLMPKGTDEFDLMFSPDVDKIFRAGVVKTLTAIGMDKNVIEEGIEVYADLWREAYMNSAFNHTFEPHGYFRKTKLEPASEEHKKNWLRLRRYEYFQQHHEVIGPYAPVHDDMRLTEMEALELKAVVLKQNAERLEVVKKWKEIKDDYKDFGYNI